MLKKFFSRKKVPLNIDPPVIIADNPETIPEIMPTPVVEKLKKQKFGTREVGDDWVVHLEYDPDTKISTAFGVRMGGKEEVVDSWESAIPDGMSDDKLNKWMETNCLGSPVETEAPCPMCSGSGVIMGFDPATLQVVKKK